MVRLLRVEPQCHSRELLLFQSHNGAIAAYIQSYLLAHNIVVSIPQWCDCCLLLLPYLTPLLLCFNPTMVRLLRHGSWAQAEQSQLFQSHNGAIAAVASGQLTAALLWCFNPTMVRLLPPAAR